MKKAISITLSDKILAKLKRKAEELGISLSCLIELILKGAVKL